jgi:hypothetical protein
MTGRQDRRRAGRLAADGATDVKRVTICLEDDDHEKLRRLGGSAWVRSAIRAAADPGGSTVDVGRSCLAHQLSE